VARYKITKELIGERTNLGVFGSRPVSDYALLANGVCVGFLTEYPDGSQEITLEIAPTLRSQVVQQFPDAKIAVT
jgi:hypothetical protein